MEVTTPKLQMRADRTSTPGYIYIGEAPILALEADPIWTIFRVNTVSPFNGNYGRSDDAIRLEEKMVNKWTDRLSLSYTT